MYALIIPSITKVISAHCRKFKEGYKEKTYKMSLIITSDILKCFRKLNLYPR